MRVVRARVIRALAIVLAFSTSAAAHQRSEGRSAFVVDESGRVDVRIEIGWLDVPELCDADLLVEPARKSEMEARLAACLARDVPALVRLKADGAPCRVAYDRFDAKPAPTGGGTLDIRATADCGQLPHVLVVDWGLFAGSALDHVSVTRIEQPYAAPKLAMLSKRAARLTIEIDRPRWPVYAGAALAIVVVAAALGAIVARRRKRK